MEETGPTRRDASSQGRAAGPLGRGGNGVGGREGQRGREGRTLRGLNSVGKGLVCRRAFGTCLCRRNERGRRDWKPESRFESQADPSFVSRKGFLGAVG